MSYVCLTVEEDCKSRSSIKRRSSSSKSRCSSAHFSSSIAHLRIAAYRSRSSSSVRSLSARSRSRLRRAAASSSDSDASRSPAIVPTSGDEMGRLSLPAPTPVEGGHRNAIGLGFGWIKTDGMESKFFGWRGLRRVGAAASAGDSMGDRFGPGSKRWGFEFESLAGAYYIAIPEDIPPVSLTDKAHRRPEVGPVNILEPRGGWDTESGALIGKAKVLGRKRSRPRQLARLGAPTYFDPPFIRACIIDTSYGRYRSWGPRLSSNHEAGGVLEYSSFGSHAYGMSNDGHHDAST
ncbi:hypothetical protein B296_00017310 [Ensete ventricosum]|uniref:Uncharacterized protein n=1 Tax=Ensete ventricosum TaxID=4639 RepID=A0A427ADA6_ENSVE|nr:hypothetical protein B296_00017310 [Ensete ventricosum]